MPLQVSFLFPHAMNAENIRILRDTMCIRYCIEITRCKKLVMLMLMLMLCMAAMTIHGCTYKAFRCVDRLVLGMFGYATVQLPADTYFATFCIVCAGILEGIFSVGMLFLGWRTLSGVRKAVQKVAVRSARLGPAAGFGMISITKLVA